MCYNFLILNFPEAFQQFGELISQGSHFITQQPILLLQIIHHNRSLQQLLKPGIWNHDLNIVIFLSARHAYFTGVRAATLPNRSKVT